MDVNHGHWAVIGTGLIILAVGPAIAMLNDTTRLEDLSDHVSNTTCGSTLSCPGTLDCYGGFDPGRVDVTVDGPRCTTPTYAERYCGIFTATLVETSDPPQLTGCSPYTVLQVIKHGSLSQFLDRLAPPPDGETILARYNLVPAKEDRRQRPAEPQPTCDNANITITDASYGNGTVSVSITNTGSRRLSLSIRAERNGSSIGYHRLNDTLPPGGATTAEISVNEQPSEIIAASTGCPAVQTSFSQIALQM